MYEGIAVQKKGILFLAVVVVLFVEGGLWAANRTNADNFPDNSLIQRTKHMVPFASWDSRPAIKNHPIPKLMADAEDAYRQLLSRQSKTLEQAVEEYQRRYNRPPPKGFDEWWKFAQENNVVMIDEYDSIDKDLAPFWELSGEQLRWRAGIAGHLPSIDLIRVRNGKSEALNIKEGYEDEVSARARGFKTIIDKFQDKLPDLDFPVNAMAEGRILVPWELRSSVYKNLTMQNEDDAVNAELSGLYAPDWRGQGNVWEAYRRTCEPGTPARQLFSSFRASSTNRTSQLTARSEEFVFSHDASGNYSFCQNPWAHYSQGHFFSDWRTIAVLFPIFSPAKAPGYLDIKIPSHYYYGQTRRYSYGYDPINLVLKEVDYMETPWEAKNDKIFWRGASTGGGSSPPGFAAQYQRHRFVRMASDQSNTTRTIVFADPPGSDHYIYAEVPTAELNKELMDVAFVKVVDPDSFPGGLQSLLSSHRFDDGGVNLGDHWKYKYLVDLDGMGYSGKFFAFLESDSAVLKSTVYNEFYSDWIQPWLHYIPLSQSYQELYNIHSFFSGPTESTLKAANSTALSDAAFKRRTIDGDRRLRRIARAGKQWRRTVGRKVDMEAYVYRLCLEYARLWSDDRESMGFVL